MVKTLKRPVMALLRLPMIKKSNDIITPLDASTSHTITLTLILTWHICLCLFRVCFENEEDKFSLSIVLKMKVNHCVNYIVF